MNILVLNWTRLRTRCFDLKSTRINGLKKVYLVKKKCIYFSLKRWLRFKQQPIIILSDQISNIVLIRKGTRFLTPHWQPNSWLGRYEHRAKQPTPKKYVSCKGWLNNYLMFLFRSYKEIQTDTA